MLPEFLIEKLEKQYGKEVLKEIIDGYSIKRVTSFRVNRIKSDEKYIEEVLDKNLIEYKKADFIDGYFIEDDENKLRNLDIYNDGKIYVQSLSSMIPVIVLDPKEKEDILDMCASPGGKTTEIASFTLNKANITACELNKIRLDRLKYNIEKQGAKAFVMQKDARKLEDFFSFNRILLDAPCSGSGTLFINNESNLKYLTEDLISKCVKSQLELLRKAVKLLKKGGTIVYSTCSILEEENEKIIEKVLSENEGLLEIENINLSGTKNLELLNTKIDGTICIKPNKYYEGFFVSALRKK